MDEKKRPAMLDRHESEPPNKKLAPSLSSNNTRSHIDAEMPWKDDLERFQKEAIWRQMQEYKRERMDVENRLKDVLAQAKFHDQHILIIDAWFGQLLDEIRIISGNLDECGEYKPMASKLLASETSIFQKHLAGQADAIRSTVSRLLCSHPQPVTDVAALQSRLTELLLSQKESMIELQRNGEELAKMQERLEDAALRYMLAEKKLDRSKSAAVAKMEKQALSGGPIESTNGVRTPKDEKPRTSLNASADEEVQRAQQSLQESRAETTKLQEQIEALEAEARVLNLDLNEARNRFHSLSEEDFSKSEGYKQLKCQNEDIIQKINDLEATNIQLRKEAEKYQAERTAYKLRMEHESNDAIAERDRQIAEAETNLTRVRHNRDELQADIMLRKAQQDQEKSASEQIRSFAEAKDERIKALEFAVARLEGSTEQTNTGEDMALPSGDVPIEELRIRYATLDKQHRLLNSELTSMGIAFRKSSTLAAQKIVNLSSLEEKIQRLQAEKHKADQKYFSTMKIKEARDVEVRSLRAQGAKSSEMISTLKDTEATNRALQAVLDKQIAEAKESILNLQAKVRLDQQESTQQTLQITSLKNEIDVLKKDVTTKDELAATKASACRKAEVELEASKQRLETTKSSLEEWKRKGAESQSEEYEMLRQLAICTVCRTNFKNTAIKTCGHVFCKDCVEERTTSRMRKCPNCNRAFGAGDVMKVTL